MTETSIQSFSHSESPLDDAIRLIFWAPRNTLATFLSKFALQHTDHLSHPELSSYGPMAASIANAFSVPPDQYVGIRLRSNRKFFGCLIWCPLTWRPWFCIFLLFCLFSHNVPGFGGPTPGSLTVLVPGWAAAFFSPEYWLFVVSPVFSRLPVTKGAFWNLLGEDMSRPRTSLLACLLACTLARGLALRCFPPCVFTWRYLPRRLARKQTSTGQKWKKNSKKLPLLRDGHSTPSRGPLK